MKKFILLILLVSTFLVSCDSPRSQRALSSYTNKNALSNGANMSPINLDNSTTGSGSSTSTPSTDSTPTGPVIPTEVSHCKFASDGVNGFESTSSHLGSYTLCQSSTDKNLVYFQLKTPPTNSTGDISICLIPTTASGANSIHVGNPMCGYFNKPKDVRKINFVKYPQYSSATITGVIFFKDMKWIYPTFYNLSNVNGTPQYFPVYNNYINTMDAYKLCMSMLSDIKNTANCSYFKNVGQYVYKQF